MAISARRAYREFACLLLLLVCPVAQSLSAAELLEVPHPDLEIFEPGVRNALRNARAALDRHDPEEAPLQLAVAYGELGMLYQAYDMPAQAEACYLNALRLSPRYYQWPYLLAYQYQLNGRLPEAVKYYQLTLDIDGDHFPALIHLGQSLNKLDRHGDAEPYFTRALSLKPGSAAALEGLAEIAYRKRDYASTVDLLQQALTAEPQADRLYYLLAMAQRRLGNTEEARANLAKRGKRSPSVADPALAAIQELLNTSQVHIKQGVAAYQAGDFRQAASSYRDALASDPDDLETRLALAWALELTDDLAGALEQVDAVLAVSPASAKAHYLKGAMLAQQGELDAAVQHLSRAVDGAPEAVPPRLVLATVLMHLERYSEAADLYAGLARLQGDDEALLYRLGMAHLAGDECPQAIEPLENALRLRPGSLTLMQSVLRAWSICPDAGLADPQTALVQSQRLFDGTRRWDTAETLAMALAANGRYQEAVQLQLSVIDQAQKIGQPPYVLEGLRHNLARYRKSLPANLAWPHRHPALKPPMLTREERLALES